MTSGAVSLIAQVESLEALSALDEIAALPRVVGMSLGTEDFSAGQASGQGAIAIDGRMIDKAVLDRALQQLELLRRFTPDI